MLLRFLLQRLGCNSAFYIDGVINSKFIMVYTIEGTFATSRFPFSKVQYMAIPSLSTCDYNGNKQMVKRLTSHRQVALPYLFVMFGNQIGNVEILSKPNSRTFMDKYSLRRPDEVTY